MGGIVYPSPPVGEFLTETAEPLDGRLWRVAWRNGATSMQNTTDDNTRRIRAGWTQA
jgi:hypothetical protein